MANWVVRNSDGEFMVLDNGDPSLIHTQPSNYTLVSVAGNACPDPVTKRWNGSAIVAKTKAELNAYKAAQLASASQVKSQEKDILAMLAIIVRAKNAVAWDDMTNQQKVDAVFAEAGLFKTFREWIDDKV